MEREWRPAKLHPSAWYAVRQLLEQPMLKGHQLARTAMLKMEAFNAIVKAIELSLSGFHALELGVQSLATGNWAALTGVGIIRAANKGVKLARDPQFAKAAAEAGLMLGSPSDAEMGHFSKALGAFEHAAYKVPVAGKVLGPAAQSVSLFKHGMDKALWDYLHTGLKAEAYYRVLGRELAADARRMADFPSEEHAAFTWPGMPAEQRKSPQAQTSQQISRDVAKYVNHAFGGLNWNEIFEVSPNMQRVARWALLAPDWTVSRISITGVDPFKKGALGRLARAHFAREAMFAMVSMEVANRVLSGHSMMSNEKGHEWEIDLGTRDPKTGRKEYAVPFKGLREVLGWVTDPKRELLAKLSPAARILGEQLFGSSSNIPTEWEKMEEEGASFAETIPTRVGTTLSGIKPYSIGGRQVGYSIPVRMGHGYSQSVREIKRALLEGGPRMEFDIKETMKAAEDNGIDIGSVQQKALAEVRNQAYGLIAEAIRTGNEKTFDRWVNKARADYKSEEQNIWRAVADRLSDVDKADTDKIMRMIGYVPEAFMQERKQRSYDEVMQKFGMGY